MGLLKGSHGFWIECCIVTILFCLPAASSYAAYEAAVPNEYIIKPRIAAASIGGRRLASVGLHGIRLKREIAGNLLLVKRENESAGNPCDELLASGTVEYCEPNYKVFAFALPNDTNFSSLWGLSGSNGIDAPAAWDRSTGSASTVVAVIDTGINYRHPDLAPNVWSNPGEVPGNGIDDDHNGYVDDLHGFNAITGSGDPLDDNGHGSHVSGTIGAVGNNGFGVAGINWQVSLMGLKFLDAQGGGSVADAIEAINYMVAMKARGINIRVANNSWGGAGQSRSLADAISRAKDAGIVFAAAAGNEGMDNDATPSYPANYDLDNVVAVAAIDQNQNLANYSNYGAATVDIAAPGTNILSTTLGSSYESYSGTSMATPHVAGAIALLASNEPELGMAELLQRMYDSALPLATLQGVVRTGRLLNAGRMLSNQTDPLPPTQPAPECSYSFSTSSGSSPDTSADQGQVLIADSDEYNFASVSLPFSFPFDGNNGSLVTLSPNGVLYVGAAPSQMDYEHRATAPQHSIAALHTDLVSTVRANISSDAATFMWEGRLYGNAQAGTVIVRLRLTPDGAIHEWVSFNKQDIAGIIADNVTIGLYGRKAANSLTYSYNDGKARDGLDLSYTPACGATESENLQVEKVRMYGVARSGERRGLVPWLTPGGRFKLRVRSGGISSRSAQINFSFDKQLCPSAAAVALSSGVVTFSGRVPLQSASAFRKLTAAVDGVRSVRLIERLRTDHKPKAQAFEGLCRRIALSVK